MPAAKVSKVSQKNSVSEDILLRGGSLHSFGNIFIGNLLMGNFPQMHFKFTVDSVLIIGVNLN